MANQKPYTRGLDDLVVRTSDKFQAGYLREIENGMWRVQDLEHRDYEDIDPFPSDDFAAMFLCRQGIAYQVTISGAVFPGEPAKITIGRSFVRGVVPATPAPLCNITIRVTPNIFNSCNMCKRGQWTAMFYDERGQKFCCLCADSCSKAKVEGVFKFRRELGETEAALECERLQWVDVPDDSPTVSASH